MCRDCYVSYLRLCGGLEGALNPPAFSRALRQEARAQQLALVAPAPAALDADEENMRIEMDNLLAHADEGILRLTDGRQLSGTGAGTGAGAETSTRRRGARRGAGSPPALDPRLVAAVAAGADAEEEEEEEEGPEEGRRRSGRGAGAGPSSAGAALPRGKGGRAAERGRGAVVEGSPSPTAPAVAVVVAASPEGRVRSGSAEEPVGEGALVLALPPLDLPLVPVDAPGPVSLSFFHISYFHVIFSLLPRAKITSS